MNLDTLEPDHAEVVALLQPYVDGELSDEERDRVALQVEANPEYQILVREQREVRGLLRGLERERASAELRARVSAGLDAVEAEQREAKRTGWLAPVVGRIRAFGKGALLMVPAVAAAGVLFVVANNAGWLSEPSGGAHIDGNMVHSLKLPVDRKAATPASAESGAELPSGDALSDPQGFAVQVAPPRSLPQGVALVSDADAGSSAMVRYRETGGAVIVDRQRRASAAGPRGELARYAGHDYHLGRDDRGRPWVEFQLGGVHHSLMLEGADLPLGEDVSADAADFQGLLVVADALRRAHAP